MFLRAVIFLSISWTNTLQVLFRPLVRQIYLELIFLCLNLISRKAYRRYIPMSRDFIHLEPLAFLWVKLWKLDSCITCIGNSKFIYIT